MTVGRGKSARPTRAAQPGDRGTSGQDDLHGIVGSGGSRVGDGPAMRAREVSAPTADDLAAAERAVVLRRAHRT